MKVLSTPHNTYISDDLPTGNFEVSDSSNPRLFVEVPYEAVNGWQMDWKENRRTKHTHTTNRMSFTSDGLIVKAHRLDNPERVVVMSFKELMNLFDQYDRAWKTYQESMKTRKTKPVAPTA